MPLASIPAADANACQGWTQQDVNIYSSLSYFLAKRQVDRRSWSPTWSRFMGKVAWTPNMGNTMRTVITEPSPHIRQFAFPQPITSASKLDVIDIKERKQDEVVSKHKFESLVLDFLPDFKDFMSHVNDNSKDIMEKQERFEDIYYRGRAFHRAPFVWICDGTAAGGEIVTSPVGDGNAAGTDAKTTAWNQARIAEIGNPGNLNMASLNRLLTVAENDIGMVPFSGSSQGKENVGMTNKFALVCSSEVFNQFSLDPLLLTYKNCQLDIINGRFQGSLFGRLTSIIEGKPLRMKSDGTFPAPETRELNPNAYNYGETVPNPAYYGLGADACPYEWAFLVGAQAYDVINVGPPPAAFSGNGMPNGFGKMQWNGEVILTKNFLVPCVQDDGSTIYTTNNYGDKLKFISQVTYGMRAFQPRNIIPILFKRKRGQ